MKQIRYANQNDIDRIAEIHVFTKRMTYRSIFKDDVFLFRFLQVNNVARQLKNLNQVLVYEDDFVKGYLSYEIHNQTCEIRELFIEPFFQNRHIGTSLIEALIHELQDIHRIQCWCIGKNTQANRFYEKMQFKPTSTKQLIEGTNEIEVLWERRL